MALVSLSETSIICSVKKHREEDVYVYVLHWYICTCKLERLRTKLDDAIVEKNGYILENNAWLDARLLDDLMVFVFGPLVDIEECLWCNYSAWNSNVSSKSTHTSHSHYRASKRNYEEAKKKMERIWQWLSCLRKGKEGNRFLLKQNAINWWKSCMKVHLVPTLFAKTAHGSWTSSLTLLTMTSGGWFWLDSTKWVLRF